MQYPYKKVENIAKKTKKSVIAERVLLRSDQIRGNITSKMSIELKTGFKTSAKLSFGGRIVRKEHVSKQKL